MGGTQHSVRTLPDGSPVVQNVVVPTFRVVSNVSNDSSWCNQDGNAVLLPPRLPADELQCDGPEEAPTDDRAPISEKRPTVVAVVMSVQRVNECARAL